jgi:2-polyprenyl-6-hydroxyphenyl methylase/3-demethylubiquinone-9 3-methyltransferase
MKPGPLIRTLFGPYERTISGAYRSIYIDIKLLVEQMQRWKPNAKRILEVGCGEGAVTERLCAAYPNAEITGIDITPRVGRLFKGSRSHTKFIQCGVQDIAADEPHSYDLVILCDVLHHVPVELRQGLLDRVQETLAPGGTFVFKDWQRNNSPIHWLCYASDRWLTGDRIHYMTRENMREYVSGSFGSAALIDEARVGPWWNNIAMLVRPSTPL